ncbi:MAG: hypothetical protein AB7S38_12245 [Vulcanimicrobiota bacterium]
MRTLNPIPFTLVAILVLLVLSGIVGLEVGPAGVTIEANLYDRVFYLRVGRDGIRAGEDKG